MVLLPTKLRILSIKENDVMDHVAGYCVAHDVSARDLQLKKNGGQWLLGKTFDTFCPIGPALVTPDEISGLYCFLPCIIVPTGALLARDCKA